jgi:hypothetical protein
MTIPQIRAELLIIATMIHGPIGARIADLARETRRRKPIRRAPRQNRRPITRAQVLDYLARHPDADYHTVANVFGAGQIGRVSEALHGKRQ